jgi:hypothetical protein
VRAVLGHASSGFRVRVPLAMVVIDWLMVECLRVTGEIAKIGGHWTGVVAEAGYQLNGTLTAVSNGWRKLVNPGGIRANVVLSSLKRFLIASVLWKIAISITKRTVMVLTQGLLYNLSYELTRDHTQTSLLHICIYFLLSFFFIV